VTRRPGLRVDVPVSWLTAGWWDTLTLAERGAYVSALAYSMGQRLDGEVPRSGLRFLDADPAAVAAALDHAADLGRMERTADGWRFLDWTGMQEQSTAEQIDGDRERARTKQAAYRERQRRSDPERVTGNVTGRVGKGRTGQGREGEDRTGEEERLPTTTWPTRVPGTDEWTDGGRREASA
jgi:hypothetical protein